jgi:hypothetical protein
MKNDPYDRGKYRRPTNRARFLRVPTLLFPPTDPQEPVIPISLETAVHHDGLNLGVFQEAFRRFATCLELLEPLVQSG